MTLPAALSGALLFVQFFNNGGHRPSMARGNLFMAHRCGFTQKVLIGTLQGSGFATVAAKRRGHPCYDLWAVATKSARDEAALRELARVHFPG